MLNTENKTIHYKLMEVQKELKVPKNQYNAFGKYKYRNAEDTLEEIKKYEEKYGFSITTPDEIINIGGHNYVRVNATFTCVNSGEQIIVSGNAREAVTQKGMGDSQITGSTASYAKKYALGNLFAIDDTKDSDTKSAADNAKDALTPASDKWETALEAVKSGKWTVEQIRSKYTLSDTDAKLLTQ